MQTGGFPILGLALLIFCAVGIFLIIRSVRRSDDSVRMIVKWSVTALIVGMGSYAVYDGTGFSIGGAFIVPFVCLSIGIFLSLLWAPHIGAALVKPLTDILDGGNKPPDEAPVYSIALARRNNGKFRDAVGEIRKQLDKFPRDVTGHMLLAEILAEHLNDVSGAAVVIDRFCQQSGHAPKNVAYALNTLADWHLKFAQDIEGARGCIERIIAALPESPEAQVAQQRLAHLGTTGKLLDAQEAPKLILKPGVQNIGLMKDSSILRRKEEDPADLAAGYVRQLEEYPLDTEAREKLALLYADHYQRVDLAVHELRQIVDQPNLPARQVVRLLHLIADLHIKHSGDCEAARQSLELIAERYPGLAAAEMARQRLSHLKLELRPSEKTTAIKMGEYEQNIGLRRK